VLVAALALRDLVSAGSADDAASRALLAKRNTSVAALLDTSRS
jgi:Spy/CpxP family protein refolding chaperone